MGAGRRLQRHDRNDVNRYNATTNTWTPRAPIPGVPNAGEGPCGALWNNKIYVAQGTTGSALYIYDIATNTWTTGANRPVANGYGCAAGALNGKLYVAGGNAAPTVLTVYDIATNTWSTGTAPPSGIFLSGYQTVGNFLYVVGGFTPTVGVNSTATMRLDMTTGTWSSGPASHRRGPTSASPRRGRTCTPWAVTPTAVPSSTRPRSSTS